MMKMMQQDLRKNMAFLSYSIPVLWNKESYQDLAYFDKPVSDELMKQWRSRGYNHLEVNGLIYDQTAGRKMPVFTKAIDQEFLWLKNKGYAFYKMEQMTVMPSHVDRYELYSKIFNIKREKIVRVLVMLEDWKSGHYFEIDGEAQVNWKAGQCYQWTSETHNAANLGTEPRYTLQITGHV